MATVARGLPLTILLDTWNHMQFLSTLHTPCRQERTENIGMGNREGWQPPKGQHGKRDLKSKYLVQLLLNLWTSHISFHIYKVGVIVPNDTMKPPKGKGCKSALGTGGIAQWKSLHTMHKDLGLIPRIANKN